MQRNLVVMFALLHAALAASHGFAHYQIGIFGSPAETAFIALVIHLMPLVSLALVRRDLQLARGLLGTTLLLSAAYGIHHHYIAISPDHVDHLPDGPHASTFRISAFLLALCDMLGSITLLGALMRQTLLNKGGRHIVLVDGHCVFCSRLVSTIMRRDKRGLFRFASVQSKPGRELLLRHGHDPNDLDSVYLVVNVGTAEEKLCIDGDAGREIWPRLIVLGYLTRLTPRALLNLQYRLFARVRYRIFGRYDVCHVPSVDERARWLQ